MVNLQTYLWKLRFQDSQQKREKVTVRWILWPRLPQGSRIWLLPLRVPLTLANLMVADRGIIREGNSGEKCANRREVLVIALERPLVDHVSPEQH